MVPGISAKNNMDSLKKFLPDSQIEVINPGIQCGQILHALFDFDGTISLIREGWQGVMIPMMVEVLQKTPDAESVSDIQAVVTEFVDRLTGKQTIYQMIQLSVEIEKRGGAPLDPLEYKKMYNKRLMEHIHTRRLSLRSKSIQPTEMMVPGALDILKSLQAREVSCYLASGTDQDFVMEEVELLGMHIYFKGIYGALENYRDFSKKRVIEGLIKENQLNGQEFVAFGDGYVEIEDSKSVGAIAIGVASNEATRQGVDEWKRTRLISAGADMIIPDFLEHKILIDYLISQD